jgi:hypothetical protein
MIFHFWERRYAKAACGAIQTNEKSATEGALRDTLTWHSAF